MVIKADSPATFAEKYIIESIWNNHFPMGSILPAERELSELIGVTRTTLREVLQRLARDGWLTIQHGKPTRVNDYMNTSGLNILDTLVTLEGQDVHGVLENLLSARTDIGGVFMRYAAKNKPEYSIALVERIINNCERLLESESFNSFIENTEEKADILATTKKIIDRFGKSNPELCEQICWARAFNHYDYMLFQGMARASGNKIYILTMNGMRKIYARVGGYYFMDKRACQIALSFYRDLLELIASGNNKEIAVRLKQYGRESGALWLANRDTISHLMEEEEA
ncbi:fatty acid metabolism transcriptional regulator FadR [Veronia nyctiphanis]|uniref:Fatty acid metabolism transcriptional regulator FadR n=1 Tax=Veronia nyctiphanis TaxID=1278244 RepID=A0A4Q0YSF1_9GAMM|nr:fatty acid metabolism transcriptional regulator FadR [Veronia nyctiphanis]RXJ73593.1 fatty acid metabolism transcriptional regulator FadR [Veronia nyctiphanis]